MIAAYVAKELLYQLGLKHVPLVDVFLLSTGFVLRVVLGAELRRHGAVELAAPGVVDAGALHLAREAARRARARHGRRAPPGALGLHRAVPRPGAGGDRRDDPDRLRALLHGREGAARRAASSRRSRSSCSACSSTCASRRCAAKAARRSTSCSPRRRWSCAASAGRSRHSGASGSPEPLVALPPEHVQVLLRVVDQDLVARGQPRLAHEIERVGPVGDVGRALRQDVVDQRAALAVEARASGRGRSRACRSASRRPRRRRGRWRRPSARPGSARAQRRSRSCVRCRRAPARARPRAPLARATPARAPRRERAAPPVPTPRRSRGKARPGTGSAP